MEILLGVVLGGVLGLLLGLLWGRSLKEGEIRQALAQKAMAEAQLSLREKAEQGLKETFQSLAAEALRVNGEQILSRTQRLLQPLEEKIIQLEAERQRGLGELVEKIHNLQNLCYQFQQQAVQLQLETSKLSQALKATGTRAKWAEIQLKRVVELAGMLPYVDFVEQATLREGDKRQRPDMIIKLPGGSCIIVDAKAPMQAYLDAMELADDGQREKKIKEHINQLRSHITFLAQKDYRQQFALNHQFVVMFLPGESCLITALEKDSHLLEEAAEKGVLLTTPLSLLALLKAASVIWRQEQINENARSIAQIGQELYERLNKWIEHLVRVRKRLDGLVEDFNEAVGSLENRVLVSARRLRDFGAGGDKELPFVGRVDHSLRPVLLPEEGKEQEAGGESQGNPSGLT